MKALFDSRLLQLMLPFSKIRKAICLSFVFVLFSLSCSDDNNPITSLPEENKNVTIMTNSSDPMLMLVNATSGYRLEYYGDRDAQGVASAITYLRATKQQDTVQYFFGEDGRLSRIIASDGVEIDLEWQSPKAFVLTTLSKDGSLQVNTLIDLDGSTGGRLASRNDSPKNIRSSKNILLRKGPSKLETKSAKVAADGNVNISVTRCGEPSEATIFIKAREQGSGDYVGDFPAKALSAGSYLASIPTSKLPITNNRKYCEGLAKAVEIICIANQVLDAANAQYVCSQLGVITSTVATPAAGILLSAACLGFNVAAEVICATAGFDGGSGGDSLIDQVCKSSFLDRHYEDLTLFAYAVGIPQNIYSSPYLINGGNIPGNTLQMKLDLGSKTLVRSLTLNPAAPAPDQDYTAEANLYCVKAGATVKVSVYGTDGFTDEIVTSISSNEKDATFYLEVPGADQGVQDVVTLEVQSPGDEIIIRTASLQFN